MFPVVRTKDSDGTIYNTIDRHDVLLGDDEPWPVLQRQGTIDGGSRAGGHHEVLQKHRKDFRSVQEQPSGGTNQERFLFSFALPWWM